MVSNPDQNVGRVMEAVKEMGIEDNTLFVFTNDNGGTKEMSNIPEIKFQRKIYGMSAILLPLDPNHAVDWPAFTDHIIRTFDAGLVPAVNMDTGYANLIDETTRQRVLTLTNEIASGREFVAGCYVADNPDSKFSIQRYATAIDQVQSSNGTPIIFQSYGLTHGSDETISNNYVEIGNCCDQFYAFELGKMFAPFGKIYSLDVFAKLMEIPQCVGAKHSSLRRGSEWDRLILRDRSRPEFRVLTGNDLAIDMVMYGSDYLLGLSTFGPDLFAQRDRYWQQGDPAFYELNDQLQYLGAFAFRHPTSAYKHSAAQFLKIRNWIQSSETHPGSPRRPNSDQAVLLEIAKQLNVAGAPNA